MLNTNQNATIPWYISLPLQERQNMILLDKDIAQLKKKMDAQIRSFFQSVLGKNDFEYPTFVQNKKPTEEGVKFYESFAPSEAYIRCSRSYKDKVEYRRLCQLFTQHEGDIEKLNNANGVYRLCLSDSELKRISSNFTYTYLYDKYGMQRCYDMANLDSLEGCGISEHIYSFATNLFFKNSAIEPLSLFSIEIADVVDFVEYMNFTDFLIGVEGCNAVLKIWKIEDEIRFFILSNDITASGTSNLETVYYHIFFQLTFVDLTNFPPNITNKNDSYYFFIWALACGILAYKSIRQKHCVYEINKESNTKTIHTIQQSKSGELKDDSDEPIKQNIHVLRADEIHHTKIRNDKIEGHKEYHYYKPQWPRRAYTRIHFGREEHIAATTCHRKGEVHERSKLMIFS